MDLIYNQSILTLQRADHMKMLSTTWQVGDSPHGIQMYYKSVHPPSLYTSQSTHRKELNSKL